MRLTLRTLLAWLDGVVPAGETEDLARKIAGSTAAGTVIDRIQAVVASPAIDASRRRRSSAMRTASWSCETRCCSWKCRLALAPSV